MHQIKSLIYRAAESSNRWLWTVYLGTFLGYVLLRLMCLSFVEPRTFPDSYGYLGMSSLSITSKDFLCGGRPFTVPLIYKFLGNNLIVITHFQQIFSIICWTTLAFIFSRLIRSRRFQPVAFGVVLMFSLSIQIIHWDGVILAESISFSLGVLFVSCWLWALQGWSLCKGSVLLAVGFFWAFARDTNAFYVLMLAALIFFFVTIKKAGPHYCIVGCAFTLFFIANVISSRVGDRRVFPFLNVLAQRVLPSEDRIAYFAGHGMPVKQSLMRLAGQWASSEDRAFYNDEDLEDFREWMYTSGEGSYISFLLTHPRDALLEPLGHFDELFFFESTGYSPRFNYDAVNFPLYRLLGAAMFPLVRPRFLIWLVIVLVMAATVMFLRPIGSKCLVPLTMLVLSYPNAMLVWHGDAMEVGRHAHQGSILLRLALWLLLLFSMDSLIIDDYLAKGWQKVMSSYQAISRDSKQLISVSIAGFGFVTLVVAVAADWIFPFSWPGFGLDQFALSVVGGVVSALGLFLHFKGRQR